MVSFRMSHAEAKWILLRKLVGYRRNSYAELRGRIDQTDRFEIDGPSSTQYQLEFLIIWDDEPGRDIRIIGSIDDMGWRACCPISYGTLVSRPNEAATT